MKNNIRCTITLTAAVLLLAACGQPQKSNGPNSDIRTLSGMSTLGGAGNVALMAAQACDRENKKLDVISMGTQNGITGATYPVILFKCV